MPKRTKNTDDLEGFYLDPTNGVYHCTRDNDTLGAEQCHKTYVFPSAAKRHHLSHQEADRQKALAKKNDSIAEERGGAVLRELANQIEVGNVNFRDLLVKLRFGADVIDGLLAEIREADIRTLTTKAQAWDAVYARVKDLEKMSGMVQETVA